MGFFISNFFLSLFYQNKSNKNKLLTHDSCFKSALKYSRSNLGINKVIYNEKSEEKNGKKTINPFQVSFLEDFWVGFFGANPAYF